MVKQACGEGIEKVLWARPVVLWDVERDDRGAVAAVVAVMVVKGAVVVVVVVVVAEGSS